jgi:PAS domain S-box-containing protein
MDSHTQTARRLADFLPHGYCMRWQPALVGTHVVADALIALAYFAISLLLWYFIKRRRDVPFHWIFLAFGLFILACGLTHVMEIVTLWLPVYRIAALSKVVTALVSVVTALALWHWMPRILQIPSVEQWAQAQHELKGTLERFQGTFQHAAIGLAHVEPNGRFLLVNRELCRMLGYTETELLQMNAADLRHPADSAHAWALLAGAVKGGTGSYSVEKRYMHRTGEPIWVHVTVSLVRDATNQPEYLVLAVKEISEQKEKELLVARTLEILQHRDRQIAGLFNQAGLGDFTWNIERNEVTAHPVVWSLYGHPEERGPKPAAWFEERQHPADLPAINAHLAKVLATPSSNVDIEFRIVRPDSSIRWVTCRGRVRRDDAGTPLEVYGLTIDISRRKLAEEAVRESERRLTTLMDALPQLIWFNDTEGNAEFLNQQWYDRTAHEKEHALNRGWLPLIHPDDLPELLVGWGRSLATGQPHEAEFRLKAKDGSYRWHLARSCPLRDPDGKIVRWYGTCTDIEELERRVSERTRDLAEANQELAKKNEEVEAFVYIVSHDLRAPLVNLQGFCKELELSCDELRQTLSDDQQTVGRVFSLPREVSRIQSILTHDIPSSLRYINLSTAKFHRLINALLEFSRYGKREYQLEELELDTLVQSTLDLLRLSIAASGVEVSIGPVPTIYGDATALGQVFANLIGNAVKYLQPGRPGRIEIGGEMEDGCAHCWVRDNGAGLPASARPRLFQVFQRFHPELAEGEGMGLAIVRRIVERHGGRIWAESEEGVGTAFHFTLPSGGRKG